MTQTVRTFAAALAACVACAVWAAEKPATEGAELGKWTMDAPAATALAKETGKPIFIHFTGSDWCGWCKLMDRRVFSQKGWQDYAAKELVLLWVDFPRDKSLVPEKFVQQNKDLAAKHGVEGYPTYVILDPDGKEIGRLGASGEGTLESFLDEVRDVLLLKDIEKLLSAEDLAAYRAAEKEKAAVEGRLEALQKRFMEEAKAMQERFQKEAEPIGKEYEAAQKKLDALMDKARAAAKK